MPVEPCSMSAEARVRNTFRALEIIVLVATLVLLLLYASVEAAGMRPNIRCVVVVAGGAS